MSGIENSVSLIPVAELGEIWLTTPASSESILLASSAGYAPVSNPDPSTPPTSCASPELFSPEEVAQDSPKIAWLKRHKLKIKYMPPRPAEWRIGHTSAGSEEEVIALYAKKKKLKHFMETEIHQFAFQVRNRAKWTAEFLGDGVDITSAFLDGKKNVETTFRPSSSGGKEQREHGLMVRISEGVSRRMTWKEFETAKLPEAATNEADFL